MRKKRKKKKNLLGWFPLFGAILTTVILLMFQMYFEAEAQVANYSITSVHSTRQVELSNRTYENKARIGAIGDILIHDTVYEDAYKDNGTYDFRRAFSVMKEHLLKPDLLLANQETILGGVEFGLSSYPMFNSPSEVGDALLDAGVDIISNANNHSLDRSETGVMKSVTYMETAGLPYVGSYKSLRDQQTLRILDKNGIKVAYLSYTYGTNGIPVPFGKEYLVNLIDRETMSEEIRRAKKVSDVIVMSIHWGMEYQRYPNEEQKELAKFLVDEGVDIIFGHHPHVLQPIEWLDAKDGRKALVVYSLGNFLSGQMWDYKDIGGLVSVEVKKQTTAEGTKITLDHLEFLPTFVSSSKQRNYQVVPLKEAGNYGLASPIEKYNEIMDHMTQYIPSPH